MQPSSSYKGISDVQTILMVIVVALALLASVASLVYSCAGTSGFPCLPAG